MRSAWPSLTPGAGTVRPSVPSTGSAAFRSNAARIAAPNWPTQYATASSVGIRFVSQKPNVHRRVEVPAGDVPDRAHHDADDEPVGEGNAGQVGADDDRCPRR